MTSVSEACGAGWDAFACGYNNCKVTVVRLRGGEQGEMWQGGRLEAVWKRVERRVEKSVRRGMRLGRLAGWVLGWAA